MEKTLKCWGCGNDEFTNELHYYYKRPELCCLKCGRFFRDGDGLLPFRGIKIERFDRTSKPRKWIGLNFCQRLTMKTFQCFIVQVVQVKSCGIAH